MAVRKNFVFEKKAQENLAWLQEHMGTATEAETLRRTLAFARCVLESSGGNYIDIRRESLPDLRIAV